MNNFPQKFKLFKTKKRIRSRKASECLSNSNLSHQQRIFTSTFNLHDSSYQSLQKSMSLCDKLKQKPTPNPNPNPTFPRYSLVAFFNPYSPEKIIATKSQSKTHHHHPKQRSEEVSRWELPEGYIERMKTIKEINSNNNNSKIFLRLNFEEKHKNRKELFMKTIQNVGNIESGKLKDMIMRKYRKSKGSCSKVIENELQVEGVKKNAEGVGDYKDYVLKGLPIRGGSPLKISRRRNLSSRNSVLESSCLTTMRQERNSFRVLEPWQVVGVE